MSSSIRIAFRIAAFSTAELHMSEKTADMITALFHKQLAFGADSDAARDLPAESGVRMTKQQLQTFLKHHRATNNNPPTFYNRCFPPNRM